jgi:Ser/Thr protein kinase RdoA (MazF antagonist)
MEDLLQTAKQFSVSGKPIACRPYASGHIHGTYLLESGEKENPHRYILQGINTSVFKKPEAVQDNISRILNFLAKKGIDDHGYTDLEIIETINGHTLYRNNRGEYWRCFRFIEDSVTLEKVDTPEQAYEGARSFGYFASRLQDYDPRRLHITIPNFMDMEWRQQQLTYAELTNPGDRLKESQPELRRIRKHSDIGKKFIQIRHALTDRVVHNDTKITNVLFHAQTMKGVCVIDLDTVMTGTLLTDFGDMVRSYTSSGAEDGADRDSYNCREDVFRGLVSGFSTPVSGFIKEVERLNLLLGAKSVIYMQAMRFLTDYLSGDKYYKTSSPDQNLHRTRNQLGLLDSLLEKEALLHDILQKAFKS